MSGATSHAKGASFERLVRNYFREEFGPHICSPRAGELYDRGDIAGVPGWTFECKINNRLDQAIYLGLGKLSIEQHNAGTPFGAVIAKRPRTTAPEEQLFVVPLGQAIPMIRALSTSYVISGGQR